MERSTAARRLSGVARRAGLRAGRKPAPGRNLREIG